MNPNLQTQNTCEIDMDESDGTATNGPNMNYFRLKVHHNGVMVGETDKNIWVDCDDSDCEYFHDSDYDFEDDNDVIYERYVDINIDDLGELEVNSMIGKLQTSVAATTSTGVNQNVSTTYLRGKNGDDELHIFDGQNIEVYRTFQKAKALIFGKYKNQYSRLRDYCEEIIRANPGSTVGMLTDVDDVSGKERFKRLYICPVPLKRGFLEGCRPVVGSDGCHVRGPHPAIAELLPHVKHKHCIRHLHNNFKKLHPGETLKDRMWSCARSTYMNRFENEMEALKAIDDMAYKWLVENTSPVHWSRSHFRTTPKCDVPLNNLCESFNSIILDA
ncbi:hypothetical protein ACH5RR_036703 [Cinchona calisaya]|uniref:Transposase n=1 Tax=Cinchona calisaya TaxID=153742 RepID=A0ABD2Y7K8_9GENT